MNFYENISPLDHRYRAAEPELWERLSAVLSEEGYINYQLKVEAALVQGMVKNGICSVSIAEEIQKACAQVTSAEVIAEEQITRHNIRALVNCIQRLVSDEAKPYVHLSATSMDIMDTARALQLRSAIETITIPKLHCFMGVLIKIARQEAATPQIGRTHGQHGVPITFGFAISEYISRLGARVEKLAVAAADLRGKIAGAVGAYNASSLLVSNPREFEADVLAHVGIRPGEHSTQIVQPEYITDLMHFLISTFGVIANFADDIRHLQRTELAEVSEAFAPGQVGSSTMPHKRNPWNFENVKSMWKEFMPRMTTVYMDQISEHQRDLTNSASSRFLTEIIAALSLATNRLTTVTKKLVVDHRKMLENLHMHSNLIGAEPLYILLASLGHPNAHEHVRQLTLQVEAGEGSLWELAKGDPALACYVKRLTADQVDVLMNPEKYTGISDRLTLEICDRWEKYLEGSD